MSFAGFFLKFGKAQHILDLQKKGRMFFNTISYFTKFEDENLRGDKLEDVIEIDYIGDAQISLKPVDAPDSDFKSLNGFNVTMFKRPLSPTGNLFCVYAIDVAKEPVNKKLRVQKRVLDFGNYCLFISDPHELIRRTRRALESLHTPFSHRFVEYLDLSKHKGPKTVFQKDLAYNYQQEFRIFIKTDQDKPVTIDIGDLSDISFVCHTRHIGDLEILVAKKDGNTVSVLHNLSVLESKVFVPINRPIFFVKSLNGVEFKFELDIDQIETVYSVTTNGYEFSIVINEAREWVIKDKVPDWIKDLEDDLGTAINTAKNDF